MNNLQLWGLRPKSREDVINDFEISKLVMLTVQQAGKMMNLRVEPLHMRI